MLHIRISGSFDLIQSVVDVIPCRDEAFLACLPICGIEVYLESMGFTRGFLQIISKLILLALVAILKWLSAFKFINAYDSFRKWQTLRFGLNAVILILVVCEADNFHLRNDTERVLM